MAIDSGVYRNVDTQFGLKLADLLNPTSIAQRQAAADEQNMGNQLRQMQVLQGVQQMQRAPVLARREEKKYQSEQEQLAQRKALMEQLKTADPETQKKLFAQMFPEKAAEQAFKPEAVRDYNQPFLPGGQPNVAYQKYKLAEQRAGRSTAGGDQRGQIVFDSQGNAFNVNPYTNEVRPVKMGGTQIQGAQYSPNLQGQIAGARAIGSETGKATGEAVTGLKDIQSQMPNLEKLATDLSELGKKATYTKTGQAVDITKRQLGMDVGTGAIARKEYISKVDNEVLPLLRQTFGAAFTMKEGESLRATLGDPDASPAEKDAVLRSFIQTKKAQVESLKRRTGEQPTASVDGGYDADKEARYNAWKAQQGR